METILYIIRHGQSEGNINGDITGTNPPLTQIGIEQAQELAERIQPIPIDEIYSSDLIRAKQTAEIIAARKALSITEVPLIRERFYGEIEGMRGDEAAKKFENKWNIFHQVTLAEQMDFRLVDNMESLNEVLHRVLTFFNTFTETSQPKTALLVTHANVMLALLAHFSFVNSINELPYGSIKNTAYIKLKKQNDTFKIDEVFGITKQVKR